MNAGERDRKREEFARLVSEYGRAVQWQDVEGEGRRVCEAYDEALDRIAALEAQLAEAAEESRDANIERDLSE